MCAVSNVIEPGNVFFADMLFLRAIAADRAAAVFTVVVMHLRDRQTAVRAGQRVRAVCVVAAEFKIEALARGFSVVRAAFIAFPERAALPVIMILRLSDDLIAAAALLIMLRRVVLINAPAIRCMSQRFELLFYRRPAVLADIDQHAAALARRLCCLVLLVRFLQLMRLFLSSAIMFAGKVWFSELFSPVYFAHMRFCFAYDLVAVLADLRAGAVFLIDVFPVILRVRAKPALARKTASASNGFGHTVFCDLFRIMVHAGPAAAAVIRHAVADRVAETSVAVSDVPAVSQCVPERQHISWLQIQCVHADARIRAVDLIFPAGALCEVLFAKPCARAFQVQTVAVDAAPENVQIGTFAELRVDHGEVFFLCPAPLSAQRVRAPTKRLPSSRLAR